MTDAVSLLAPAKINLVLEVLGRREDGYHELRTVFQTLDLSDRLEIAHADGLRFSCDEPGIPEGEENLVVRAARALAAAAGIPARAAIRLHKRIPSASGLGGGSSDAAATLIGLASLWRIPSGAVDLTAVAAGLGSDVPFFLWGGTALGLGRGEMVYPLRDLPPVFVVLAGPHRGLSTAQVYASLEGRLTNPADQSTMSRFLRHLLEGERAYAFIQNDLQPAAARLAPEIDDLIQALRCEGARAAALSGSGSAVFGLFPEESEAHRARAALDRHPAAGWTILCRTREARGCARGRPERLKGGRTGHGHH